MALNNDLISAVPPPPPIVAAPPAFQPPILSIVPAPVARRNARLPTRSPARAHNERATVPPPAPRDVDISSDDNGAPPELAPEVPRLPASGPFPPPAPRTPAQRAQASQRVPALAGQRAANQAEIDAIMALPLMGNNGQRVPALAGQRAANQAEIDAIMALPLMGNNGQLERPHAPPAPQLAGISNFVPPLAGIGQLALGYALPAPLPQVDYHTLLARLKALEDSAIATAAAGASRATPMMLTLDPYSIAAIRADKTNGIGHNVNSESDNNFRRLLIAGGMPNACDIIGGAAIEYTDNDGIPLFYKTFCYITVLGNTDSNTFRAENYVTATSATRKVLVAARTALELLKSMSKYRRAIHDPKSAEHFDAYYDTVAECIDLHGDAKTITFDLSVRKLLFKLANEKPSENVGFEIVRGSSKYGDLLRSANNLLTRAEAVAPPAQRFKTGPTTTGTGAPTGGANTPAAPSSRQSSGAFALVLCQASGTPIFDLGKFTAAKSCFRYQMTGVVCGPGKCAMVNSMSSAVQADRDKSHVDYHLTVCSSCGGAHVAGCHATPSWLAANPALAAYTFP
ncbi:hypothetical protein T492DRAFT_873135 [Pavlovales sp. CCMP2436]|nr:hypothetical protein T492DRAFT_873135 [Pavlovales sp. CCMP2436]